MLYKTLTASELKVGKPYTFTAQPLEGSSPTLSEDGSRNFSNAIYQGREGGDLVFKFNGQPLYIDPSVKFQYAGYGEHGGRKSKRSRKSRKSRKSKRSRKSRTSRRY